MRNIRLTAGAPAFLLALLIGTGYAQAQSAALAVPQSLQQGSAAPFGHEPKPDPEANKGLLSGVPDADQFAGACYCALPSKSSPEQLEAFQACYQGQPDCDRREWEEASDGSLVLICVCGRKCAMSELEKEAKDG